MSWEAAAWAMRKGKDYDLEPVTRFVMLTLANYADKEGNDIYPSLGTLEADTGLSERTIRRHIKTLIEVKLLDYGNQEIVKNHPRIRADQRPKVYLFLFERESEGAAPNFGYLGKMPSAAHKRAKKNDRSQSPAAQAPAEAVDNSENEGQENSNDRTFTTERPDTRPDTESTKPINRKDKPDPAPNARAFEPVDLSAGMALRAQIRERLIGRGTFTAEAFPDSFQASDDMRESVAGYGS